MSGSLAVSAAVSLELCLLSIVARSLPLTDGAVLEVEEGVDFDRILNDLSLNVRFMAPAIPLASLKDRHRQRRRMASRRRKGACHIPHRRRTWTCTTESNSSGSNQAEPDIPGAYWASRRLIR